MPPPFIFFGALISWISGDRLSGPYARLARLCLVGDFERRRGNRFGSFSLPMPGDPGDPGTGLASEESLSSQLVSNGEPLVTSSAERSTPLPGPKVKASKVRSSSGGKAS